MQLFIVYTKDSTRRVLCSIQATDVFTFSMVTGLLHPKHLHPLHNSALIRPPLHGEILCFRVHTLLGIRSLNPKMDKPCAITVVLQGSDFKKLPQKHGVCLHDRCLCCGDF